MSKKQYPKQYVKYIRDDWRLDNVLWHITNNNFGLEIVCGEVTQDAAGWHRQKITIHLKGEYTSLTKIANGFWDMRYVLIEMLREHNKWLLENTTPEMEEELCQTA